MVVARRRGQDGLAEGERNFAAMDAKDEEIEKDGAVGVDLEDVKLKIAKKGLSTQTAMQRMMHALADKTGLVDYASVHGGGRVLKHSTLSPLPRESDQLPCC